MISVGDAREETCRGTSLRGLRRTAGAFKWLVIANHIVVSNAACR